MATYAIMTDIIDLYGEDLLIRIADLDKDGQPDEDVVEKALEAADALIDAYLSSAYSLPLPSVPDVLRTLAIDIAVYKLPITRAPRTDEMRKRYEDALAHLKMMAAGKMGIGLPTDPGDGSNNPDNPNVRRNARTIDIFRG